MVVSDEDRALVAAAVTQAELSTAGEIVTAVSAQSDRYHDAALHWAVLAMLGVPALLAWRPEIAARLWGLVGDGWASPPAGAPFVVTLIGSVLAFLLVRVALSAVPLRMALTPGATKTRRVRRQALALFRVAVEQRTTGRTGVLIYLSLAERRAEIIADAGIHGRVPEDVWAGAMAAMLAEVRHGRPGAGMAAAVAAVGVVLAEHSPRAEDDVNELPDRLVEI